ncbi:MAG: four-carbon acid sugar kinase family protein [Eubacteriales bacterium]|nr:four-carbon acid sugar kinase family protein [Eubacteriales bacterium]
MTDLIPKPLSWLETFPKADEEFADKLLKEERQGFSKKIIILDDDPTGTQTVHDVPVFTDWSPETLQEVFSISDPMVFLLTNSRSFSRDETREVHREIGENIAEAARKAGQEFLVVSRGDSTLRGHFPLETEVLRETLEKNTGLVFHGEIICPFFKEGGRYTIGDVHYVREGDQLTPAGQTEFARDKTFSYENSHLGAYVEEKSMGTYKKEDCISVSLEELREFRLEEITDKLAGARDFQKIIVNAIDYVDVKIFCICWLRAMKQGRNYLARSAAALTRIIGGVKEAPLLSKDQLTDKEVCTGGLVVVGSHVKKSTDQLNSLMESGHPLHFIEFNVSRYFTEGTLEGEVRKVLKEVQEVISAGTTVVVYTSRRLVVPDTADKDAILGLSVGISDALTRVVSLLTLKPRFIIAKGGITSSDVATKGLSVRKAMVMGQIKKGIPVWMTGPESKFPNMPYIIFPGNVGEVSTLREIVEELD